MIDFNYTRPNEEELKDVIDNFKTIIERELQNENFDNLMNNEDKKTMLTKYEDKVAKIYEEAINKHVSAIIFITYFYHKLYSQISKNKKFLYGHGS